MNCEQIVALLQQNPALRAAVLDGLGMAPSLEFELAERVTKEAQAAKNKLRATESALASERQRIAEYKASEGELRETVRRLEGEVTRWSFLATELAGATRDHGDCDGCAALLSEIRQKAQADWPEPVATTSPFPQVAQTSAEAWTPSPGDRVRNYLSPTDLGTVQKCEPEFQQFGTPVLWDKSPSCVFYVSIAQLVRVVEPKPNSPGGDGGYVTRAELIEAIRVAADGSVAEVSNFAYELRIALRERGKGER